MLSRTVLLDEGMRCLSEKLGLVEAERFISVVVSEHFDYTEWRRENLFVGMSVDDISREALAYQNYLIQQ